MFFILSKIAWMLLQPLVAIALLVLAALLLRLLGFPRTSTGLGVVAAVFFAVAVFSPLGLLMIAALENRFPRPSLPEHVDGIVVLGGSFDTRVATTRFEPELNEAGDRVTSAVALALRYPEAKVIFSGGVAAVFDDDVSEADSAEQLFSSLGLPKGRLILESRARNTVENALFSKELGAAKPGETWLLVTSAYHMPRAVGCFRTAGFDVVPYPVDYRTPAGAAVWRPSTDTTRNLEKVHFAIREYIGLMAYRLTGRTDALFPAPSAEAPSPPSAPSS
ncbi:YdcF family protein [Mangrovicella endophytica]|uniref:YdcF family protein n=1 Tax=Mangrovicella endophytica TaxID=2066697 RepID=UPI000C9E5091|nr:YdcF family protein [Mangrovicella endophytica]